MQIENPAEVEVTLHVTMRLKDWQELRRQLTTSYPSWKLASIIQDAVLDVTKSYCAEKELTEL
jgi:hypothetical protein